MQTIYKPSQFNCTAFNEQGELLIYNTLTCKLCKTSSDNSNRVLEFLSKKEITEDVPYPSLVSKGYLVPITTDELAVFQNKLDIYCNSTELEMMILPTHQCNCRCVYCYEDFKDGIMPEKVQNNLVKYTRERLRSCTSLHISWFGGEPLVAGEVIRNLSERFMDICKAEHKRYTASITTNGTLLTPAILRELQKYRVFSYQITIDGAKEVHDSQRPLQKGGSSYELIMRNLLDIKREVKGKNFIFFLRINVTKRTLIQMKNYISEMEDIFGGDSRFQIIFNVANDWGGDRIINYRENLLSESHEVDDAFRRIHSLISSMKSKLHVQGLGEDFYREMGFHPGCYVNKKNYITVDSTGLIYKCAQEIRNGFPNIGDLSEDNFSVDSNEDAKWSVLLQPPIFEKCKKCFLLPVGCYRSYSCVLQRYQDKYLKNCEIEPKCPNIKNDASGRLITYDKNGQSVYLESVI